MNRKRLYRDGSVFVLRLLAYAALVALLVTGAVWLADHPGTVMVEWLGWHLETPVPLALAGLILLTGALLFLWRLLAGLVRLPGHWRDGLRGRRLRRGYQALSDGLAAAAGGDRREATRLAGKARKLLADPALTSFLSAQSAQLAGDADTARDHFKAMLERPETAALGLRGLLKQALERGDDTAAADLAARARLISPGDGWLLDLQYRLAVKAGHWSDVQALITEARRHKTISPQEARRRTALLLTARAEAAAADGAWDEVRSLGKKAMAADKGLTAAALLLARAYQERQRPRPAAAVLEQAWSHNPAPALAAAYAALKPEDEPLPRLRRLEKLVAGKPNVPESHLVLAEAALSAKLWGQARKHLLEAVSLRPSQTPYRLLAQLERQEYKNEDAARAWEAKRAEAQPDPTWVCADCGKTSPDWHWACPHCGALDRLVSGTPKLTAE